MIRPALLALSVLLLLVELSGKEIRDIHDFMYVLQSAKPDEKSNAVVVRGGKGVKVELTFGTSRR